MEEQPGIERGEQARELRNELLRYLDRVYAFAQAVTLDERTAERLVEETYRRAFDEAEAGAAPADPKAWLFDLVLSLRRGRHADSGLEDVQPIARALEPPPAEEEQAASLQQRWAEQVMERLLPLALAGMPEDLRTVLVLCDVEGVPCAEAGRMLDMSEESACVMLEVARERLMNTAQGAATETERELLETALPPDWIQAGLRHILQAELPPVPPALQMAVEHVREQAAPREATREQGAPVRLHRTSRRHRRERVSPALRGALVALLLILGTGAIGLLVSQFVKEETEVSLIALMARAAEDVEPTLQTDSPEQAEQFVRDRLGFRLTLPEIDGAELTGVGISELSEGVEMPVFVFGEPDVGEPFVLYVFTYTMLDRYKNRVTLESDILNQIADEEHFDLHDLGQEKALIWRNRDDIFIAITQGDAEALRERIFFPS